MIKLQTPVEEVRSRIDMGYDDRILVVGSCFADNIGTKLKNAAFDVCVNPFGTLYNPVSICNSLQRLASGIPFGPSDCVPMGAGAGLICSFSHHISFARADEASFLEYANASLEQAADFYKRCNKVIVTLGTAWCYRFNENGETVSNCLKRPAAEFSRYRLSVQETQLLLDLMVKRNPDKEFIFTVSPVRHLKDGAHGNRLSKATLLLALDGTLASNPARTDYFPAYEILDDELRDYRFYAEDMLHPSEVAVSYLWERFKSFCIPESEKEKLLENEKLFRRSQHRSLH